jgi:hypothetical protein
MDLAGAPRRALTTQLFLKTKPTATKPALELYRLRDLYLGCLCLSDGCLGFQLYSIALTLFAQQTISRHHLFGLAGATFTSDYHRSANFTTFACFHVTRQAFGRHHARDSSHRALDNHLFLATLTSTIIHYHIASPFSSTFAYEKACWENCFEIVMVGHSTVWSTRQ